MNTSLFEQLGGDQRLRQIIDCFVDRIFADAMIGFFFSRASKERIKAKEYEFAAAHLGGGVEYTGRPLANAHAAHPIQGGQFQRRLQILREVLDEFEVPEPVRAHWIAHTESLRSLVTRDQPGRCDPEAALDGVPNQRRFLTEKS